MPPLCKRCVAGRIERSTAAHARGVTHLTPRAEPPRTGAGSVVSPSRPTPTLHAVARLAGVSVSTASRCLSGAARVAVSTKQRVQSAAEEVGYHHNALVGRVMRATRRGQVHHHLGTLAFVAPVAESREWRASATLVRNWDGARERAESFGFGITEFTLGSRGMTGRRLGEILTARGITGVLLAAFPADPHEISLPWDDFVFVQVGHCSIKTPRLDCVVSDHTEAVSMAARRVVEAGYRRVGLAIERYQDEITDGRWSLGYAGLRSSVPQLADIPPLLPTEMGAREFVAWIVRHKVDCVLTLSTFHNELNAMGAWLTAARRRIGWQVGLVSLDVTSHQDWSGVEQHPEEIGRAAIDLLFSKLQAGERGVPLLPRTLQVHGHWHDGETLPRPAPDAAARRG